MIEATNERNLHFLLCEAAAKPENVNLLRFLLEHAKTLNIDVYAKGEFGTAMDIAIARQNEPAIEWLKKYTEQATQLPSNNLGNSSRFTLISAFNSLNLSS